MNLATQPYLKPGEGDGDRWVQCVRSYAYCYLNFESVTLKIPDKARCPPRLYGEVKVTTDEGGTCIYIYHRHGSEAEPVDADAAASPEGFDLTLGGPNHCVISESCFAIPVNLWENRDTRFFSGEFSLYHEMFGWNKCHLPITLTLDLPDERGTLELCFTRIVPSIPTRFEFFLVDAGGSQVGDSSVRGTIKAKHYFFDYDDPTLTTNWWTMFKQDKTSVEVPCGGAIPLPRTVFLMPVRTQKQAAEDVGCCLTVEVNLGVTLKKRKEAGAGQESYSIRGQTKIAVKQMDRLWRALYFELKNESESSSQEGSRRRYHELHIKICAVPVHEHNFDEDEECLFH